MKRNVDINEISDGRLYSSGDMVKADCRDCRGCSDCCRGMGNSIILDPMDIWRLALGIKKDFASLVSGAYIELGIADGMILPNLKMDSGRDACPFLDGNGRCSVHEYRPGLCRLFPLGRFYEEKGFRYFIQIHECSRKDRSKIKIRKWLEIPDLRSYENYILKWHDFLNECEEALETLDDEKKQILMIYVLRRFYETGFSASEESAFYGEFDIRIKEAREKLGMADV